MEVVEGSSAARGGWVVAVGTECVEVGQEAPAVVRVALVGETRTSWQGWFADRPVGGHLARPAVGWGK